MFKKLLKKWLGVTYLEKELQCTEKELRHTKEFVALRIAELKDYTRVDCDIGIRGSNTIILTGVYRNRGYVRFWDVGDGEFIELINRMNHMRDHCLIRNVDEPSTNFRGVFDI